MRKDEETETAVECSVLDIRFLFDVGRWTFDVRRSSFNVTSELLSYLTLPYFTLCRPP